MYKVTSTHPVKKTKLHEPKYIKKRETIQKRKGLGQNLLNHKRT